MDRRSDILEIAREKFLAKGYGGVSMDEILAEVGGSKATLYRHFPSKADLFRTLVDEILAALLPPGPPVELYDAPLEAALEQIGRRMAAAALSAEATALYRLVHSETPTFPEIGRRFYERGPAVSYANLRAFLEAKRDRGELEFDESQPAAEHFLSAIVGLRQLQLAVGVIEPPQAREIEAVVRAAVAAFVRAYGVPAMNPRAGGSRSAKERVSSPTRR